MDHSPQVGRHGDILGYPLFAILAMLRAVATPLLLPVALPLLSAASERSNTKVPLGPTASALLAVALSVFGGCVPPLCCGTQAGSYLRLIDSCITQLKAQGPRTCNESKEEEEEEEEVAR